MMADTTATRNFSPRRQHLSREHLLNYKIHTLVSSVMLIFAVSYYAFDTMIHRVTPLYQSWPVQPATPFTQSGSLITIYWLAVAVARLFYAKSLWSSDPVHLAATASVAGHHVLSDALLLWFGISWVQSHSRIAEVLLVVNFFNLSFAYFRCPSAPFSVHTGVVAGPLAWNFAALYWFGAIVFPSTHVLGRLAANASMWGWLGYGVFFLRAYRDFLIGFALSLISFSTALGQIADRELRPQIQGIFATTVGGILFILSLAVCIRECLVNDECQEEEGAVEREKLISDGLHAIER